MGALISLHHDRDKKVTEVKKKLGILFLISENPRVVLRPDRQQKNPKQILALGSSFLSWMGDWIRMEVPDIIKKTVREPNAYKYNPKRYKPV